MKCYYTGVRIVGMKLLYAYWMLLVLRRFLLARILVQFQKEMGTCMIF